MKPKHAEKSGFRPARAIVRETPALVMRDASFVTGHTQITHHVLGMSPGGSYFSWPGQPSFGFMTIVKGICSGVA